jgi:hypothetical protein
MVTGCGMRKHSTVGRETVTGPEAAMDWIRDCITKRAAFGSIAASTRTAAVDHDAFVNPNRPAKRTSQA